MLPDASSLWCLPMQYVSVRVTVGALVEHRYIFMRLLAAEPRSTARISFTSQCMSRLLTRFQTHNDIKNYIMIILTMLKTMLLFCLQTQFLLFFLLCKF